MSPRIVTLAEIPFLVAGDIWIALPEIISIDLACGPDSLDVDIVTSICGSDECHSFTGEVAAELREFLRQEAGAESWETGPDVNVDED